VRLADFVALVMISQVIQLLEGGLYKLMNFN